MGILLAYALLTVVMYSHNSSKNIHGRVASRPITASSFRKHQTGHSKPIGIMPKTREEQGVCHSDYWEIDLSQNIMDMQLIVPTYLRSLQKHQIMKALIRIGFSQLQGLAVQFTAFQPSTTCACECDVTPLTEQLSSYGLKFTPVLPNGDCFFAAVATTLISDMQTWQHPLSLIGGTSDVTVATLAGILREAFVRELLGKHQPNHMKPSLLILTWTTQ